jgi:hypothetical protein
MKFLKQISALDASAIFSLPPEKYKGIFISFDGTNQSGQTFVSANLGTLSLYVNGIQKWVVDLEIMSDIVNLEKGVCAESSTQNSTFLHTVYVPFNRFDDVDLCYDVTSGMQVQFQHSFPAATSTVIASGTVTYAGVLADDTALSPNFARWNNFTLSPGAAGTVIEKIPFENIAAVYVENDAYLTYVNLIKDGKPVFDTLAKAHIYNLNQMLRNVESWSASLPFMKLDLAATDEFAALNDDVRISLTVSAACTIRMIVLSVDSTPTALQTSIAKREIRLSNVAATKEIKGAPASVIQRIKADI